MAGEQVPRQADAVQHLGRPARSLPLRGRLEVQQRLLDDAGDGLAPVERICQVSRQQAIHQ